MAEYNVRVTALAIIQLAEYEKKELRRWGRLWGCRALANRVSFTKNVRLRATVARYVLRTQTIELGPRFFRLRKERLAVLCHEAAHAAVVLKCGPTAAPHGSVWARLVKMAGYPTCRVCYARILRRHHGAPAARHTGNQTVFEHRCPVCHFRRLARRHVPTWRCPECVEAGLDGMLQITRFDRTKS